MITQKEIEKVITRHKRGELLFLTDFRGLGSDSAIRKSLSRITKAGKIRRIAQGIYLIPIIDPILGELMPSMENIAEAVAKKEKIRIKPVGTFALNKLGLSTQVPLKHVYITDGAARTIKVGKNIIKFKPTTPKKLSLKGKLSSLVVQALEEIGTQNLDQETTAKIKSILEKEDEKKLLHDIKLASSRISDFLLSILKSTHHD